MLDMTLCGRFDTGTSICDMSTTVLAFMEARRDDFSKESGHYGVLKACQEDGRIAIYYQQKHDDAEERLKAAECLGQGASAEVHARPPRIYEDKIVRGAMIKKMTKEDEEPPTLKSALYELLGWCVLHPESVKEGLRLKFRCLDNEPTAANCDVWFSMTLPLFPGTNLEASKRSRALSFHTLCPLINKYIIPKLQHLHAAGFTHSDIKPANIMFDETMPQLYLIDTGFVSEIGAEREGFTPGYQLPNSDNKAKIGDDIWALLMVMLQCHNTKCDDYLIRYADKASRTKFRNGTLREGRSKKLCGRLLECAHEHSEYMGKQMASLLDSLEKGTATLAQFSQMLTMTAPEAKASAAITFGKGSLSALESCPSSSCEPSS